MFNITTLIEQPVDNVNSIDIHYDPIIGAEDSRINGLVEDTTSATKH
jgi:hypothetical protein